MSARARCTIIRFGRRTKTKATASRCKNLFSVRENRREKNNNAQRRNIRRNVRVRYTVPQQSVRRNPGGGAFRRRSFRLERPRSRNRVVISRGGPGSRVCEMRVVEKYVRAKYINGYSKQERKRDVFLKIVD